MIKSILKNMVSGAISATAGYTMGRIRYEKKFGKEIERAKGLSDKHYDLYMLMNQWVRVKQEGKGVADYLKQKNYKKIAIYGMSYVGETLVHELYDSGIEIAYGIDRKARDIYAAFPMVSPDDRLELVDAVIVTAVSFFDEIAGDLCTKIDCPILSLEDIVYEVM